ncbi:hypothetical protein [Deinococcus planocerae]|uniref:hypothetical protein n=1 Tax=Deinococcus planocerae TaxID=1737569 RepID=UPI000C7F59EB|nr:hypothetical protein [Deinococcus planocerae]
MNVDDPRPTPGHGHPLPGAHPDDLPDPVAWHADGGPPEGDLPDEGHPTLTPEQFDAALERWR